MTLTWINRLIPIKNPSSVAIVVSTDEQCTSYWLILSWCCILDISFNGPYTCTLHAWQRPEQGWFKVNADGSLNGTKGCYGALIRDHDGLVIAAAAGSQRAQSVILHELQGIELGIRLAHSHGIERVELSMDSSNAVKYITTNKVPLWEAVQTTRRIREEMRKFAECKVMHAVWETNQAADKLSRLLPNHEYVEIISSSFAEDIKKIVFNDARGRKYSRM